MAGRDLGFGLGCARRDAFAEEPPRGRSCLPHFTQRGGTPAARVAAFIQEARERPCWLDHVDFDAVVWDVTGEVVDRAGCPADAGKQRLFLSEHWRPGEERRPLPACVRDFTAAVLRMTRGVRFDVLYSRLDSLRYLGQAMVAGGISGVAGCDRTTLDAASALASGRVGSGRSSAIGAQLGLISVFLARHKLTEIPIGDWVPPDGTAPLPQDGEGRAERALDRLPASRYLSDLGEAFGRATTDVDLVLTGALALQCATMGSRISGVLNLQDDCDTGRDDGDGLAFKVVGSKGRIAEVVDIAGPFTDMARTALRQVRDATADARAAKRAYDTNPRRLYLAPEHEHLRSKGLLTAIEAGQLVGIPPSPSLWRYLRTAGIELTPARGPNGGRSFAVRFTSLERHFLSLLPARMRAAGGPNYHPLFLLGENAFRRETPNVGCPCMFQPVTYDTLRSALRSRSGNSGLFRRLGIDRAGAVDRTHASRHFFTTLLRARHVPEDDIAHVARRTNVFHNRHYEHVPDRTGADVLADVAGLLADGGSQAAYAGLSSKAGLGDGFDAVADALMSAQGFPSPAPSPGVSGSDRHAP